MARQLTPDLERMLDCPVCLEQYTEPRVLPCLHSLCLTCLTTYTASTIRAGNIQCPVCKASCAVPSAGPEHFPPNFYVKSLVDQLQQMKITEKMSNTCSTKGCHEQAVKYCTDGCQFLCETCCQHHERFAASASHQVVIASEVRKFLKPTSCHKHPGESVHLFCRTCQQAGCSTCLLLDHKGHDLTELSIQAEASKTELRQLLNKINMCFDEANRCIQSTNNEKERCDKDIVSARKDIDDTVDKLHKKLDKDKEALLDGLQVIQEKNDTIHKKTDIGQKEIVSSLHALNEEGQIVLKNGSYFDVAGHLVSANFRMQTMSLPDLAWSSVTQEKKSALLPHDLGSVDLSDHAKQSCAEAKPLSKLGVSLNSGSAVTGLAVLVGSVWVVQEDSSTLTRISMKGKLEGSYDVADLMDPASITALTKPFNQLVISNWRLCTLHWVEVTTVEKEKWDVVADTSQRLAYSPAGMALAEEQNLLLVTGLSDNTIHVYNSAWDEVHKVTLPQSLTPWKCLFDRDSQGYIVLDIKRNQLVWVVGGEEKACYPAQGQEGHHSEREEHRILSDVIWDADSLLVSDRGNSTVCRVGTGGGYLSEVLGVDQSLDTPNRLCVDPDPTGPLITGHCEGDTSTLLLTQHSVTPNSVLPVNRRHVQMTLLMDKSQ